MEVEVDHEHEPLIVWSSHPDAAQAATLATTLVQEKLAACVHLFPLGRSFYIWEGALTSDAEQVLMIKTRRGCYQALEERIRQLHPYSVPEILAVPVTAGAAPYLEWLERTTRP